MKSQQTYGSIYPTTVQQSSGIPMASNHIHRTESELQFYSDMEAAEWRDLQMFHRLVKGISMKQQQCLQNKCLCNDPHQTTNAMLRNEQSIQNIISTRQQNIVPLNSSDALVVSSLDRSCPQDDSLSVISDSSSEPSYDMSYSPSVDDEWSLSGYRSSDEVMYPYSSSSTSGDFHTSSQDNWSDNDPVFEIEL